MIEARQRNSWSFVSSLLAAIFEVNRDHKKRGTPFQASEFNPMEQDRSSRSLGGYIRPGTPEWKGLGKAIRRSQMKRR